MSERLRGEKEDIESQQEMRISEVSIRIDGCGIFLKSPSTVRGARLTNNINTWTRNVLSKFEIFKQRLSSIDAVGVDEAVSIGFLNFFNFNRIRTLRFGILD